MEGLPQFRPSPYPTLVQVGVTVFQVPGFSRIRKSFRKISTDDLLMMGRVATSFALNLLKSVIFYFVRWCPLSIDEFLMGLIPDFNIQA